jgi:cytochrome P450
MTTESGEMPVGIADIDPALVVDIDMFGQEIKANPAPMLRKWACNPPFYVVHHGRPQAVICRYHEVLSAFTDYGTFSRIPQPGWGADTFDYFNGLPTVGDIDPPEHGRLRRLMSPAFAPRRMTQVQGQLEALTDELLAQVAEKQSFDMVSEFAQPLVRRLLLGIFFEFPREDWHIFTDFSEVLGLVGTVPPGAPKPTAYMDRFNAGYAYCAALIAHRQQRPKNDLVGDIVSASEAGVISVKELFGTLIVLFAAGIGTTSSALSLGLLRLCRHPDQLARLRQEPQLIGSAVEECLRIDTLGLFVHRYVVKDTVIGGTPIRRGMLAHLAMGAANFDPTIYPHPDRFDIGRNPRNISTFGFGPHFCVGHALARTVMRTAISRLVQRFPEIRLADPTGEVQFGGLPTERAPIRVQMCIN